VYNKIEEKTMIDWVKARLAERTSWDGATIVGLSLLVLMAAPVVKLLAWPALVYGLWTLYKEE
tara:strand:- start:472 stop:660 length:189 start_codon:yes stop_codon:yes gene_type:complete